MTIHTAIIGATVGAVALLAQVTGCQQGTIPISTIDQIASGICAFAPSLDTVNQLINANGALKTAEDIAKEVCNIYNASKATVTTTTPGGKLGAVAPGTEVKFVTNYNGKEITISGTVK
jgi:hypothetical protein